MKHIKMYEKFEPKIDIKELKNVAKSIKHCGDYGFLYLNEDEGKVYWVCGDSDGSGPTDVNDPEFTHTTKQIRQMFSKIKGVDEVIIEAECMPGDDKGYKRIQY